MSGQPGTGTAENPLDRALSQSLAGEHAGALALALGLLEGAPESPGAWLMLGRSLAALGRQASAARALSLASARAVYGGNLPLALAAAIELGDVGGDRPARLAEVAGAFHKGSARLHDQRVPPDLSLAGQDVSVTSATGDALLDLADQTVEAGERSYGASGEAPLVPPQGLFSLLTEPGLRAFLDVFEELTVEREQVVVEEGTEGSKAFVVARGELEVRRSPRRAGEAPMVLARLGSGALFGEMSLLSRSPRAASVVAVRPSIVLSVDKEDLDRVAGDEPEVGRVMASFTRRRMIDNLVRTSSILGAVRPRERSQLLERFVTKTFEAGERLIVQGEESSGLYLVASGALSVLHREEDDSTAITQLGPGEVVGEVALVLRRPSTADVVAQHPTVTLHLPRDGFQDLIKAHPQVLAELYELAVKREEETRSLVAQQATDVDDFVLL